MPRGGLLPVQRSYEMMECTPYRRRGFLVPNISSVPKAPVFLHREPLKTRRVHQEPLYGTARPFRTPGGPLRYRMIPRQKGERPCLRRIFQTARKEKAIAKSAARNAAASKKITAKKFAMPPQSYSVPLGKASMPQSYSVPPESPTLHRYLNQKSRSAKLTGFLVVGRRIELLLRD